MPVLIKTTIQPLVCHQCQPPPPPPGLINFAPKQWILLSRIRSLSSNHHLSPTFPTPPQLLLLLPTHYPPHSFHTHICPRTTSPTVTHTLPSFGTLHHVTDSLHDADRHLVTRSPNHAFLSHAYPYPPTSDNTLCHSQSLPTAQLLCSHLHHPCRLRRRPVHSPYIWLALPPTTQDRGSRSRCRY